jgi:precorrin-2 dehydrogenase/sirohydrochlorin ferrochelatase
MAMLGRRPTGMVRMRERIGRWRRGSGGDQPLERVRRMLARWARRGRRWQARPYYPAILDLVARNALVVGAGRVGEGKIRGLLNAGAHVKVVSLEATDQVRTWAEDGRIELHLRAYETHDLDGCFLVIAATERQDTNVRVSGDAEARQMLCNVVDVPHLCNFILPSIMRRGDLLVAVSTAGASPALARKIRLSLEEQYGEEYAIALQLLGSLREEMKQRYPDPRDRKVLFERIVYSDLLDMIRAGDVQGIESWVERCIREGPSYTTPAEHEASVVGAPAEAAALPDGNAPANQPARKS